jgi:hypothetical protein
MSPSFDQPGHLTGDRNFSEPFDELDLHRAAGFAPAERAIEFGNGMPKRLDAIEGLCGSVSSYAGADSGGCSCSEFRFAIGSDK